MATPDPDGDAPKENMERALIKYQGLKFKIPDSCRTFSPFPRLPAELRHKIWETTLTTPGMHFLRIDTDYQPTTGGGRWWTKEFASPHDLIQDHDEEDPVALEVSLEQRPRSVQVGELRPLYPTRQADISYYTSLHRQIAKLSVTCNESDAIAKSLVDRPGAFRLENGRIISLGGSTDVIYLDYVPPEVFETGFRFKKTLHCEGLDQIRKVAVRYCHKWDSHPPPRRCPNCGQVHPTDEVRYPNHIYRFLAQYLPNLEQFYYVDYFILRKHFDDAEEDSAKHKARCQPHTFESGNRTYYEVSDHDWKVQPKVWVMKKWLQEQFVKYAKTSKLSKHQNPEKVQFGVLACEWAVGPMSVTSRRPLTPVKKGHNKRRLSEDSSPARNRRLAALARAARTPVTLGDWSFGLNYVFGAQQEQQNAFEFTVAATP